VITADESQSLSLKRNIAANYLGRAYSIGAIYLFVPFYMSILGDDAYGLIAFYTIILSLTALADVGLSAAFAREAARVSDKHSLVDLLATIEGILFIATGTMALVLFFEADFIALHWLNMGQVEPEDAVTSIRIMALTAPFQLATSLYLGGLLGLQRQGTANLVQALTTTLRSGLVILPLIFIPDIKLFFLWQLFASLLCCVLVRATLLLSLGRSAFSTGRFSPSKMISVLGFAGGMLAITIISALNTQMDKLVVSSLFSVKEFGYYTLASTLAQLPYAVTAPILVALLPRWTSLVNEGQTQELAELYENYSALIALVSSIGAFGLLFFAGDVLDIWLRQDHLPPVFIDVTAILAGGGLCLSLAALPFYFGLAHGHNRTSIFLGGVTMFLTTPLLLVASTRFGLIGAAIPWVVLNAITLMVLAVVVNGRYNSGRNMEWATRSIALPLIMAAVPMFLARILSNLLDFSSLASCLSAALCGGIVISLFLYRRTSLRFA
jgi:O-antigen/teichoic acid export membrane protein